MRGGDPTPTQVSNRLLHPRGARTPTGACVLKRLEFSVLDFVSVLGVIAVFALVALVAKGVQKL